MQGNAEGKYDNCMEMTRAVGHLFCMRSKGSAIQGNTKENHDNCKGRSGHLLSPRGWEPSPIPPSSCRRTGPELPGEPQRFVEL